MDHKPSNPETDSWVDDRMAKLNPAAGWSPDAEEALDRLNQRKPALTAPWMRLAMTTTILAGTVLVLTLLPWQRFWTPKQVATVAAKAQTGPAAKPVEQQPETSVVPQQTVEKKAPPAATTPVQDNLQELAKARGLAGTSEASAELAKAEVTRSVSTGEGPQTGVTQPTLIHNVQPQYTQEAKLERVQGTIEIVITVKADGTVEFVRFNKTLGYGLDEKAREAVEQWLFSPGTKDGKPVGVTTSVSINFSLR